MPGLFQGLEIGRRALLSQQAVLQTIGHNIANLNTPGYSRQRVRLMSTQPEISVLGQFGSGVTIESVRQVRDLFLGTQYRTTNKDLGKFEYEEKTLSQIESLFNEPQDNSLGNTLNEFFNAFSSLSTDPGDSNSRRLVLSKARQLITGFRHLGAKLQEMQNTFNKDLVNMVKTVNGMTSEIARINQQIKVQELGGSVANDLRDRRDLIIDDLSNMIDVNVEEQANGSATVYMGAMAIVDGDTALALETQITSSTDRLSSKIFYKGSTIEVRNLSGQIAGLLSSRDEIIPKYIGQLNTLANFIVDEVNKIHVAGFGDDGSTGNYFFDPTSRDAINMKLDQGIELDISKIAASSLISSVPGEGNNLIALALSELRNMRTMNNNNQTFGEFYDGLIGDLGIQTRETMSFRDNTNLLLNQIENNRQSVQGVSLDEELTNMIKAQHAFDAAARIITTMDQALETVIKGMGIVGR